MALVWGDEYLSGIPEIDEQHKTIFREMGTLGMSLLQGKPSEEILQELRHLAATLREHINYEELMMFQRCLSRSDLGALRRPPAFFTSNIRILGTLPEI